MTTATETQDLRALLQRFIDEVINKRDFDGVMVEMVADDFVEQNPLPGQRPGRDGLADTLKMMVAGFPDLVWTIRDTVVDGDRIAAVSTWTGTHDGDFMGIPPTGRSVSVETWTLDRYRDGIFVESRIIMDIAGLLGQVGVLPGPGGA